MVPWNAGRAKVQIKLSTQRLRTLQEKKLALAKKARRDIADLVAKGRIETAKLRVESLIQDDIYVELLELLELYAETLLARFGLLDQSQGDNPEPAISDAVCSIVYAATRTEVKELHVLREILMHKYGREFSLSLQPSDPPPATVPPRVLSKLALYSPPAELVDAYLGEIARGYGVAYDPLEKSDVPPLGDEVEAGDSGKGDGDGDNGSSGSEGGTKASATETGTKKEEAAKEAQALKVDSKDERKVDARTPSPANVEKPRPTGGQTVVVKKPTEEDELAARFDRLKNLR